MFKRMIDHLTSPYIRSDLNKNSPETNIGRLFKVLSDQCENLSEINEKIRLWDDLDHASGAVLDRYGLNFGVKRGKADDEIYRLLIKVKLLSQISGGDCDTLINAASALLSIPTNEISLAEIPPAKVKISVDSRHFDTQNPEYSSQIQQMLKRIVAAGVGLEFAYIEALQANIFVSGSVTIYEREVLS